MKDLNAVLIVEDELITANSVAELLTSEGFDVAGLAADANTALSFFTDKDNTPSVILCDINIRGSVNGIELARQLKEITCCEIIFLTAYSDTKTMYNAFDADPAMYIVKPFNDRQVLTAVHLAFHKFYKRMEENNARVELQLTKREREIAELVMEGYTTKQVSEKLFISLETVRTHRRKMLQKNNIHSFSHLVYMLSNQ